MTELKCMRHRKCPTTLLTWAVGLNVKRLFHTSSAHFTRLWGSALSPSQSAPKGQRKSLDRVPAGGGSRFRGTSKYPFHGRAVMSSPNSLNCQINWERRTHTCVYSCQLVLLCVNSSDGVMWELPPLAHLQYWNLKPACFEVRARAHTRNFWLPSFTRPVFQCVPAKVHLGKHLTDLALHFKYRRGYTNENLHGY